MTSTGPEPGLTWVIGRGGLLGHSFENTLRSAAGSFASAIASIDSTREAINPMTDETSISVKVFG